MKLDFNGAIFSAKREQVKIRRLLEQLEYGDFGDEIKEHMEMLNIYNGTTVFLLEELSEKINLVAAELRNGNQDIVREFFDFLCIDISETKEKSNERS